jgi:hypothetical protein
VIGLEPVGGRRKKRGGMFGYEDYAREVQRQQDEIQARTKKSIEDIENERAKMISASMGGRRKRGGQAAQISSDIANRVVGGRKKRAPSARGAIVRKVMAEQGLSLPQASKYVKDNGLY